MYLIQHKFLSKVEVKPIRCLDLDRAKRRVLSLDFAFIQEYGLVTQDDAVKRMLIELGCTHDSNDHFIINDRVQIAALFNKFPNVGVYEIVPDTKKDNKHEEVENTASVS